MLTPFWAHSMLGEGASSRPPGGFSPTREASGLRKTVHLPPSTRGALKDGRGQYLTDSKDAYSEALLPLTSVVAGKGKGGVGHGRSSSSQRHTIFA